jgi:hypothetical protein
MLRPEPPLFQIPDVLREVRHAEKEYDDFKREPLLPNRLSRLGPGLAWRDVDGD